MAKVFIEDSTLTAIGNAIRNKKGTNNLINPANFAAEIEGIETGSTSSGGDSETLKALIDRSLTSITIPNGVTTIGGYAFRGCSKLTNVTIPSSVTEIKGYAFSGCSQLTNVTISNGVTTIGSDAFSSCSKLTNVTIPSSVTSIGSYALRIGSTSSKATITMMSETPPDIMTTAFDTSKLEKIRIPAAALEAYSNNTNWSSLISYFETY